MHHRLHLTASDLLGAAALGRRRDRRDPLRVVLLLQDRLEVSVQPAELGGELLLRRRAPRRDTLRRLLPQMAQQQLQQLTGLPRRDRCRGGGRWVHGLDPARLERAKRGGDIGIDGDTGRQVVHVGFDHRFLHARSGAEHDSRREPPHRMHGQPRRARLRHTGANRNGQLDRVVPPLPKALTPCPPLPSGEGGRGPLGQGGRGGRGSDQTEPEPRRPRPNRFHHLRHERAAEHGDFGLRVALERVE